MYLIPLPMSLKPSYGLIILLAIIAFPLFAYLDYLPIRLWDESRLAVNSYEMFKSGNWLILTFKGEPDFWNAKPPMMIWMQVLSMKLVGISELALRLPSAFAAVFNCLLIFWFFAVKHKNTLLGLFACLVLVTCIGYVRQHGTRTGDFDSLLVFFTTAYSLFYFLYLEEDKRKYFYAFIFCLICASLTKGIASLIFMPAILLYTIISRKAIPLLKSAHLYIGIAIYLFFVLGYYFLREHYNPGYIANVIDNEITGRYMREEEAQGNPYFWYYYDFFISKTFRDWYKLLLFGIVLGLFSENGFLKKITLYSLMLGVFYFLVVSGGQAKAEWYDMATYPFFAIITAVGLFIIFKFLAGIKKGKKWQQVVLQCLLLLLVAVPAYTNILKENFNPQMGLQSDENHDAALFLKSILHNERKNNHYHITYSGYNADVDWYVHALMEKGNPIPFADTNNLQAGQNVIAFHAEDKNYIENFYNFSPSETFYRVTVYRINGKK